MKFTLSVLALIFLLVLCPRALEAQWVARQSGVDSVLTDVAMVDSMTAYAVSHGRSILRTTNRGNTWIDLTAPLSYVMPWNAVAFYDSENGMAAGDHGAVFTIRGGSMAGWCRYILYGPNCLSVLYTTPASIYVGADSGQIYHSLDSGRTWSSQKISEWPIRSLFIGRGYYAMGPPVYALTSHSVCSRTEFPSTEWSEKILPQLEGLGSEAFDGESSNGGGPCFIVGVGGDLWSSPLILRKMPAETSWVAVPSNVPGNGPLYGVSAPSLEAIYACGAGGSIAKSTDGGDTWVQTRTSSACSGVQPPDLRAISFVDEYHGFAVGESGIVLYTSNGGLTDVEKRRSKLPANFVLEQNYPNPFNPVTAVSYRLSAVSAVCLKVFDVLGRVVTTLVDGQRQTAGKHSVHWDGNNHAGKRSGSGIYYIRLTTEYGSQTIKAVLVK